MLKKLSAGMKSSELLCVVVVSTLGSWLISRGATADTVLAMSSTAAVYIGGRSFVEGAAAKNGK